jgi:hypothetical protein
MHSAHSDHLYLTILLFLHRIFHTAEDTEKDTLLKDQFHDLLMEALAKDRSFDVK